MDLHTTVAWLDGIFPSSLAVHEPTSGEGFTMGVVPLGSELLATTLNFADVDTGLQAEGMDVRSEIFTVARTTDHTAMNAVHAAAESLRVAEGALPAQPGTLVPALAERAGFPSDVTVAHGLLVSPYVWGGEVPRFTEDNRLTVLLQLVMITEEEFNYAVTYGVEELQLQVIDQGIDIHDWGRGGE